MPETVELPRALYQALVKEHLHSIACKAMLEEGLFIELYNKTLYQEWKKSIEDVNKIRKY